MTTRTGPLQVGLSSYSLIGRDDDGAAKRCNKPDGAYALITTQTISNVDGFLITLNVVRECNKNGFLVGVTATLRADLGVKGIVTLREVRNYPDNTLDYTIVSRKIKETSVTQRDEGNVFIRTTEDVSRKKRVTAKTTITGFLKDPKVGAIFPPFPLFRWLSDYKGTDATEEAALSLIFTCLRREHEEAFSL